jgi:hypothetical protein
MQVRIDARRQADPATQVIGMYIEGPREGRRFAKLLREVGCNLPVQVWHHGPIGEELDDDPLVRLVDVRRWREFHPARILRGWEIKTYALAHCGFRRVLYLDADAYCVADPTPLFAALDAAPFAFWEDLHFCSRNVHWEYFGVNGQHIPPVQGGHLLFDLSACWRFLMVAHWLNMHSDYSYGHSFGDQDAWRVALALTATPFGCLGKASWKRLAFVCAAPDGRPMIVHRCRGKLLAGRVAQRHNSLPLESRVHELFREVCAGMGMKPAHEPVMLTRRELAHKARGR